MAEDEKRAGIDTGPNSRPLNEGIGQTGPGIPDDAASEGYDPVADTEAEHDVLDKVAKKTPSAGSGI